MGSRLILGFWALETLAWNPDYLSSAALSLARLTRLDPGGRLVNRPARSRDIFICWYPNTTASLERRLNVLDTILQTRARCCLVSVDEPLPEHHSTAPTHEQNA